ncbi:hypothetical protein [Pleionea sediminis]|uniref:hypothetical protein n=1 Tax=Pleionea sediminis TaxID=2569479 RepID=UPI00118714C5|nr:hypothetical protein [Pleionea sediminis]
MKIISSIKACILGLACLSFTLSVQASDFLIPELKKFEPFVGHTYKGVFKSSTPEKPMIDISRWERHLNGTAIRIEHSLNEGEYGGESIIFFDRKAQKLRYFYFTTAVFFTEADVTFDGNILISREKVTGNQNGITEVKSKAWLLDDGSMKTESQYLKNGKWIPGHSADYTRAPEAKVIFR